MANLKEIIGKRVSELRKKRKLTQPQLAKKVGTSQSEISRIEKGGSNTTVDILEALGKALHCRPWELQIEHEAERKAVVERFIGTQAPDDNEPARKPARARRKVKEPA